VEGVTGGCELEISVRRRGCSSTAVELEAAWDVQDERGLKGFYFIYYRYVFFF
jgi:hypothetical protein